MQGKYILDENKKPKKEDDLLKWAEWFENADRIVAKTNFEGDVEVSTIFLGLDHNFLGEGLPILFETMIFGGEHDQYQERYTTWEEAEEGHERAVSMVDGTILITVSLVKERNNG